MSAPVPFPPYAGDLFDAPLMGVGMPLVTSGRLTLAQLEDAVGAIVTLAGVAWAYAATDPGHTDIAALIGEMVSRAPADCRARYDAAIHDAEGAATALADGLINPNAESVPVIGPVLARAADAVIARLIEAQGARFLTPPPHR